MTSTRYKYFDQMDARVYGSVLNVGLATHINHVINRKTELSSETKTFNGIVRGANDRSSKWELETSDGELIKGYAQVEHLLTGVKIGGQYAFKVVEAISLVDATDKEIVDRRLLEVSEYFEEE